MYTYHSRARVSIPKSRHLFTTREVDAAIKKVLEKEYVKVLGKRGDFACIDSSLLALPQVYGEHSLMVTTSSPRISHVEVHVEPPSQVVTLTQEVMTPPPQEVVVAPPTTLGVDMSSDDELELVPLDECHIVNKSVYIKRCKRARCDKERYKKGMCKSHYYAYRKKNPWA